MLLADYIIDHQNIDWGTILADWAWLLPEELTVWLMNCYGDLFLIFDDGSIHLLDVGAGTIERLADDKDDFCQKIDEGNNANQWLMIPLVDRLVEAGNLLSEGCCYSFVISPVLGGQYSVENTATLSIVEHYSLYASIHQQIEDLPNGTTVKLTVQN
ncbi:MAG: DUF1851 domain-containing protein [Blastocatellia bacterium]|nr:DUF1851 domain-containing protein [Blastocatellia bacterium]